MSSVPLSPAAFKAALLDEGCIVQAIPGWDTHDRADETGLPFGPVVGITDHHTGSDKPADQGHDWCLRYAYQVLYLGRPDLPGSLCHGGICPHGIVILTGTGRCNHAGRMAANTYAALRADAAPVAAEVAPGPDVIDGNDVLYGLEVMYSGVRLMSGPQYAALVKANAALCRAHGWTGGSVVGHREITRRKPDPGSHHMGTVRADTNRRLATGPATPPAPKPAVPQEDLMQIIDVIVGGKPAYQQVVTAAGSTGLRSQLETYCVTRYAQEVYGTGAKVLLDVEVAVANLVLARIGAPVSEEPQGAPGQAVQDVAAQALACGARSACVADAVAAALGDDAAPIIEQLL